MFFPVDTSCQNIDQFNYDGSTKWLLLKLFKQMLTDGIFYHLSQAFIEQLPSNPRYRSTYSN